MAFTSLIVAAGIAVSSTPQAAQTPVATPATAQAAPEKTCKKFIPTGSIMPKKFCFTKDEWREFDSKTQAGAESFLARRTAGSPLDPD